MALVLADIEPVYTDLGVALAIGLLLGLQRERSYAGHGAPGPAGARTFPIVALLGGLSVLVDAPGAVVAGLIAVALLTVAGYLRSSKTPDTIGLTTEVLLLLTYVLGAVAVSGKRELASIVGAAALVLTAMKGRLHGLAGKLTDEDENATIKMVAIALLVVPLLPDRDMGPFQALNPREIGWMVLLVAGISFVGYVVVKTAGTGKGIFLTGILGGLVSSTATTVAFARRSKEAPPLSAAFAASALAACTVVYPRLLVVVTIVSPEFAKVLWPYLTVIAIATLGPAVLGLMALRRAPKADVPLRNPFELGPAIVFALIFAAVGVAAKAAQHWFGQTGLYVTGALAGTTDLDAITLTAARLFGTEADPKSLAKTVAIAAIVNATVKAGIAWTAGAADFGRRVAAGLLLSVVAGGAAFFLL